MQENVSDYVIRTGLQPCDVSPSEWDALLADQDQPTPFMRHAYLQALHDSGSACADTGWEPAFVGLWRDNALVAACPLYLKDHSYGEYVFDWAWADAYQRHGLRYYPKALIAVPFTPVPGSRLLARDAESRRRLCQAVLAWCEQSELSSLHLLFASEADLQATQSLGWMQRHTVQFHWQRQGLRDFDDYLASLTQEKRKKIRQERRRVQEAGVSFRHARGTDISAQDWAFFYQCYERTYLEHGNRPYLQPGFFADMARHLPDHWLLFTAQRDGRDIACSLIGLHDEPGQPRVAYGRYWGALERVDCLHFEACYYQPLNWCLTQGFDRFEGGAQGEHKMARALLPVSTHSAHWLAHPGFAQAVENFLEREETGVSRYLEHLHERSPLRRG
ncbi:MAG: GNAT family N-acetyltransferase [Limnohabitans sp.]